MKEDYSHKLLRLLHASGKTLATAESCTGGGIAASIIAVSGASEYFKGGVVAYCNSIKESVLHVSHDTLERYTAVSEQVAIQMAEGVMQLMHTDYAVSITGIAGPGGGTDDIPVGTIWICCMGCGTTRTLKLTDDRGREENLRNGVEKALALLAGMIENQQS